MGDYYRVGDEVKCQSFGSTKAFRATVVEVDGGKPTLFRDRHSTLIKPSEVVSFDFAIKTRTYGAKCEIITGICNGGNWMPETKRYTFRTEAGLSPDEIRQRAYSVMAKRWSTGRFIGVTS